MHVKWWLIGIAGISWGGAFTVSAADLVSVAINKQMVVQQRLFDGVIEAVHRSTVSAQTRGRIIEINYDVDDFVPKGAVVLRLRDNEQSARASQAAAGLSETQARYKEAGDEFRRIKDIYAKKLVAKSELDKAEAAFNAARARLEQARAKLAEVREQLGYTVIKAPFSGYVTKRHVDVGEAVDVGQPLMAGLSLESLRATVNVPQAFVGAVRAHNKAVVTLPNGQVMDAASMRVFPYADENSHAFKVRVNLPQGEYGVYPGMFVKVAFVTGEIEALLVPQSAVAHRSELTAVYTIADDGRVGFRQVRLGRGHDDRVEILAGLESGEQIALDPIAAGIVLKQQGH